MFIMEFHRPLVISNEHIQEVLQLTMYNLQVFCVRSDHSQVCISLEWRG